MGTVLWPTTSSREDKRERGLGVLISLYAVRLICIPYPPRMHDFIVSTDRDTPAMSQVFEDYGDNDNKE